MHQSSFQTWKCFCRYFVLWTSISKSNLCEGIPRRQMVLVLPYLNSNNLQLCLQIISTYSTTLRFRSLHDSSRLFLTLCTRIMNFLKSWTWYQAAVVSLVIQRVTRKRNTQFFVQFPCILISGCADNFLFSLISLVWRNPSHILKWYLERCGPKRSSLDRHCVNMPSYESMLLWNGTDMIPFLFFLQ